MGGVMKTTALVVLLLPVWAWAQEPDTTLVRARIDSLEADRAELQQRLANIDEELAALRLQLVRSAIPDSLSPLSVTLTKTARLRKDPYRYADEIGMVSSGSQVVILGFAGDEFWKVATDKGIGFMSSIYFSETPAMRAMRVEFHATQEANRVDYAERRQAERRAAMIKKYGQRDGARIAERKIWIGMTDDMAQDSRGSPTDINRTVTASVVHEQWVYVGAYLYFENGRLTSWQD
jgi:hypothetical protein